MSNMPLPKGQFAIPEMPRFGMPAYANRFPDVPSGPEIEVRGPDGSAFCMGRTELSKIPATQITADFHCVTTWSVQGLTWGGYRFADIHKTLIAPYLDNNQNARFATLHAYDGYRACFHLDDLLADDVLLATHLNGAALTPIQGGPMRLIAPAQYGFKSVKSLKRIEIKDSLKGYRTGLFAFMDHPRGRVAHEERGGLPGWLLRYPYRMLIGPGKRHHAAAYATHLADQDRRA